MSVDKAARQLFVMILMLMVSNSATVMLPIRCLIEDYPFVVSVMTGQEFHFTATLVSTRFVVSRAELLTNLKETGKSYSAVILAGATYPEILKYSPENQRTTISSIIIHDQYEDNKDLHDIGLIKMEDALKITRTVKPIRYATRQINRDMDLVEFYDFCIYLYMLSVNITLDKDYESVALHKIELPLIDLVQCQKLCRELMNISPGHVCTAYPEFLSELPWGGPLVCNLDQDTQVIQGVRAPYKHPGLPVVFIRVDKHSNWIHHKISLGQKKSVYVVVLILNILVSLVPCI